jgi:hypothetical protein
MKSLNRVVPMAASILITGFVATTLSSPVQAGVIGSANSNALEHSAVVSVTGANGGTNGGADKTKETVSVAVVDGNTPVPAKCTLTNEHGDWSLSTPDTVTVRRSSSDLQIKCEAPGYAPVQETVKAATIKIPKPQFHFSTDAGGDGDDDGDDVQPMISVPNYASNITVVLGPKAPAAAN